MDISQSPIHPSRFQLKPKSDLLDDGKHILHRNIMEDMERDIMAKPDQKVKSMRNSWM